MTKLALALAAAGLCALATPASVDARTWIETPEAKEVASVAADEARMDMLMKWGDRQLQPGDYLWDQDYDGGGEPRVVVDLSEQLAYLYMDDELVAVSTISSGKPGKDTPTGIFPVMLKRAEHYSSSYDNAPMPFMQRLDDYGIALHAGKLPGYPASMGCVRLPMSFAKKLFRVTEVGTEVLIGA